MRPEVGRLIPRLKRAAGRAMRSLERVAGGGPYHRLAERESELERLRSVDERHRSELETTRAKRDLFKSRLDELRAELEWRPPEALGWYAGGRRLVYADSGAPNPYLQILYHRLSEIGLRPEPHRYPLSEPLAAPDILHLHWLPQLELIDDAAELRRQVDAHRDAIATAVDAGVTIVRTVHELHARTGGHADVFDELTSLHLQHASAVHTLHPSAAAELADRFQAVPGRVFVVEHPLYTGAYPDFVDRATARRALGVGNDEILLLGFGAIRPYKGFDRLVSQVERLPPDIRARVRVLIIGPGSSATDVATLQQHAVGREHLRVMPVRVPDDVVQFLFRAADLCVLPYRPGSLASGVLMLAWTFNTPVVAPHTPVTASLISSGPLVTFDASSDDDLAHAIASAVVELGDMRAVDSEFRRTASPSHVARRFAEELQQALRGTAVV